jgi:hypothetical protein
MLTMRGIEERAMTLYRQGKVPGSFYDGYGQEAVSAGAAWAMAPQDRLCILHRDLAAHLIRGVAPARIFAQYMGRAGGVTGGREGNVHFGDRRLGCVGMVSMLPDMMLVAAGMAMAFKLRGEPRCAITWFGDGSTSRGDFHEAMNWAGVQRLGVIFVLENNQYAYSTPTTSQFAVSPVERAAGLRLPGLHRRRQRRRGDVRGDPRGARARDRRAGPDADRGGDDAHARPRRARRHEVRAASRRSRSGDRGPRSTARSSGRSARRGRRGAARRVRPRSRRRRGALPCRCRKATPATDRRSRDRSWLSDGLGRGAAFADRRAGGCRP